MLIIRNKSDRKFKFEVGGRFCITLHAKDLDILNLIKDFFGIGSILYNKKDNSYIYVVTSLKGFTNVIIPHFNKYPLITHKQIDFYLFKLGVELLNAKEHLTLEGINKFVSIKASINKGLSPSLEEAFPNCTPHPKPSLLFTEIQDPN